MKAILFGTKEKSIAKFLGAHLSLHGWDIWLCSRSTKTYDEKGIKYRKVDITNKIDIKRLLNEVENPDLVVMSADAASVFGNFKDFKVESIKDFFNTKIIGNILFIQEIIKRKIKTKTVFLCGKIHGKDKSFFLYSLCNLAIEGLVEELNNHFPGTKIYYLETPLISPSSIGDMYLKNFDSSAKTYKPNILIKPLNLIINDKLKPGKIKIVKDSL